MSKRLILLGVALAVAVGIVLTGTFAWQSINQQALNPASGGPFLPLPDDSAGGRLHDDYEVVDDWYPGRTANKDVYIENFGLPADGEFEGDEPIFVRIRLYEFMAFRDDPWPSGIGHEVNQIRDEDDFIEYEYRPLVTGAVLSNPGTWNPRLPFGAREGARIRYQLENELEALRAIPVADRTPQQVHDLEYKERDLIHLNWYENSAEFVYHWLWEMGGQKYFMPTFNRDPNCNMSDVKGAAVDPRDPNRTSNQTVWDGITMPWDGVNQDRFPAEAGEEDFWENNPYWEARERQPDSTLATNRTIHEARPTLYAEITTMATWTAMSDAQKDAFVGWVIDRDGWAYWSQPLMPGDATGLLLSSITLQTYQSEYWYYAIFIDAEMATADYWNVGSAHWWNNVTDDYGDHGAVDGWFNADNIARGRAPSEAATAMMMRITEPHRTPAEGAPAELYQEAEEAQG